MTVTINYNRDKDPSQNVTGIDLSILAAEEPGVPAAPVAGTTGILAGSIQADADESGGATVLDLFTFRMVPTINSAGLTTLSLTATPILGDTSLGTAQALNVQHPQTMDEWQAAAGRAQQP